jgi:membrane protease YdiL (CAAX protease family)
MERLDLILTHAAALFFGAILFRAAARRLGRVPIALFAVPAFEELCCRLPLLLAFDAATHAYAFAGVLASASAFAASRFFLGQPPLAEMPRDADDAQRKRLGEEKSRDFASRMQAFALGFMAGIALGAIALQSQNLLLAYSLHVIGKFTIHRLIGISRAL